MNVKKQVIAAITKVDHIMQKAQVYVMAAHYFIWSYQTKLISMNIWFAFVRTDIIHL